MFFMCVTVGLVILASKYRDNVLRGVKKFCNISNENDDSCTSRCPKENKELALDKIILADSPETCDYAVKRIRCNLSDGVLGFDCEWVNEGAVSLVQLATFNGVCALFRIGKIGHVPAKLKELLSNDCILKVGVAPYEDGRKLTNDYGCRVFGTVDLRTLANRLGVPSRKSLAALTMEYLGVEMDKILEVRCGDWNADILTEQQKAYAAYDAIASVLIYHKIQQRAKAKRSIWKNFMIYIKSVWQKSEGKRFEHRLPEGIIDTRFKEQSEKQEKNNNVRLCQGIERIKSNGRKSHLVTRKEPLYHNCYLEAPDGETLCTCDRKKAEWYVAKNLGVVVTDNPFAVRLNFEPSGRAFGQVGQYYTQVKINQCVVCGSTENFIKKNVVPREYRKYFPLVMKAHQSHDVLLLCPTCHEISNRHDLELRRHLAEKCDAPITRLTPGDERLVCPADGLPSRNQRDWASFLSAVKALRDGTSIPLRRRKQLEAHILEFTGCERMTPELPNLLYEQFKNRVQKPQAIASSSPLQTRCQPHGMKVVNYFTNREGGLVTLERMWREHFLQTMKPLHLPKLWSVSHNQERLAIRQTQSRIEPEDAKLAGLID